MALGFVAAHLVNYAIICCSLLGENKDLLLPWCRNVWKIPTVTLLSLYLKPCCTFTFLFFLIVKKSRCGPISRQAVVCQADRVQPQRLTCGSLVVTGRRVFVSVIGSHVSSKL